MFFNRYIRISLFCLFFNFDVILNNLIVRKELLILYACMPGRRAISSVVEHTPDNCVVVLGHSQLHGWFNVLISVWSWDVDHSRHINMTYFSCLNRGLKSNLSKYHSGKWKTFANEIFPPYVVTCRHSQMDAICCKYKREKPIMRCWKSSMRVTRKRKDPKYLHKGIWLSRNP